MKQISTYLLLALMGFSFQACGGGSSEGGESGGDAKKTSLFAHAQKLSLRDAQTNVHLNSTTPSKAYTIENASPGYDYYIKLTASPTNKSGSVRNEILLETYEGETLKESYKLPPSYTRIYQINKESNEATHLLIKGAATWHDYTFSFENFPGLEEGLVQDSTTFEPNDHQALAYKVENNTLYHSRANPLNDPVDWYLIQNAKEGKDYYLEFTSDPNNGTSGYTKYITLEYYDADGQYITEASGTNTVTTETGFSYTNKITAPKDGNIYLKVTPHYFGRHNDAKLDDRVCKYSFKTYKGLSEGLQQDSITYEPNNFQSLAYPIALDQQISSRVYGRQYAFKDTKDNTHIDKSDWFVLDNVDPNKKYILTITADSSNPTGVTIRNLYVKTYDRQGILKETTVETGQTAVLTLEPTMSGELSINITGSRIPYLYKYQFVLSESHK